jgi:hypothetical protein
MPWLSISGDGRADAQLFGHTPTRQAFLPSAVPALGFIQSRSERAGAAALVAILHAAVIAVALLSRPGASRAKRGPDRIQHCHR